MSKMRIIILCMILPVLTASLFATVGFSQPPETKRGARADTHRVKVSISPAAQLMDMRMGTADVYPAIRNPSILEELYSAGKYVFSRPDFSYSSFIFNMRRAPLSDVNFRHALVHLLPKDRIIGSLYRYLAVKLDVPVPPSLWQWYNSDVDPVDPHPYSPAEAEAILGHPDSLYAKIGGIWKYKNGLDLEMLTVPTLKESVAPDFFYTTRVLLEEARGIGLLNFRQEFMDSIDLIDSVVRKKDFGITYIMESVDKHIPTHLDFRYNLDSDFALGPNLNGLISLDLKSKLGLINGNVGAEIKLSLGTALMYDLSGGSIQNPLAQNVRETDPKSQYAVSDKPGFFFGIKGGMDAGISGMLNPWTGGHSLELTAPTFRGEAWIGYRFSWSLLSMYWNTPNEYRPGTNERMIIWIAEDYPERLNPAYSVTASAWSFMHAIFDRLTIDHPYDLRDEPWLASSWSYESVPDGMDVTFNLKLTDSQGQPIRWQDGKPVSAEDVRFAWDFAKNWAIPLYWADMRYYDPVNTVIVNQNTIKAHMTSFRYSSINTLATLAYLFPPQVWTQNPATGAPWTGQDQILSFDPSALSYPQPGNYNPGGYTRKSLPTQLFGTGPFILQQSTGFICNAGFGDLSANRDYFMTTNEIQQKIADMFHLVGDVNYDGIIDTVDMSAIGLAYLTVPGDDLWNTNADISGPGSSQPDNKIDIFDIASAGRHYSETRTVP